MTSDSNVSSSQYTDLIAVTISRKPAEWNLPAIPWYCFQKNEDVPMLEEGGIDGPTAKLYQRDWKRGNLGPRRYISYLAKKRNMAISLALERWPDAEDVLMCDTYYLPQVYPILRLIRDYNSVKRMGINAALGGAAWGLIRTRVTSWIRRKKEWYDKWGVPDLTFTPFGWTPEKDKVLGKILSPPIPGLFHTSSLTGISIWPRSIWDKGARYGVFDDLHGCEHNYFFEKAMIPTYTDFNAVFYRKIEYPFIKCVRCSAGAFIRKSLGKPTEKDMMTKETMDHTQQFKA